MFRIPPKKFLLMFFCVGLGFVSGLSINDARIIRPRQQPCPPCNQPSATPCVELFGREFCAKVTLKGDK